MNQTIRKRIEDINNGIVPEGYKQTPFGIFPCDWETDKKYGDLFEFNSSLSKSREELGEEGYAYLHYGDMHRHSFNTVSYEEYMCLPKANVSLSRKEKYLMKDGDVAFLDASEDLEGTSRCVLIDNPGNESFFAGLHTIPAREKEDNFSKWYKQYITLPDFVKKQFQRLACGFKVYGLNKDTIAKIDYAFPKDKTEQGKIAEILMKWDEMVELQEQYIQKLELRKKAIMKKLLIPKEGWQCVQVKDIFQIIRGQVLPVAACNDSHPYPVYSSQTINDGLVGYYYEYLFEDCITWTTDGANAGEVKFRKGKFYCTNVCGVLKSVEGYANQCVAYIINSVSKNYVSYVGNPKLMNNTMGNIIISLPKIDEQKSISFLIEKLDEEISLQKEKLEKIKIQRKAMQQYLLTGIVRVS